MHRTDTAAPVTACPCDEYFLHPPREDTQRSTRQRANRWELLGDIQRHLLYQGTKQALRVRVCRKRKAQKHEPRRAELRSTTTGRYKANFQNVRVCGSVWLCPCCSQKIRTQRAAELDQTIRLHGERGGGAVISLLSVSHYRKHSLRSTQHALKVGWTQTTKQRDYKQLKDRFGIVGYAKTLEVTQGKNGWHPHYHVVWFTERPLTDAEREQFDAALYQLWMHNVTKYTDRSVNHEANHVQKIRTIDAIANYLSKSIAFELTHGHTKDGKMPTQRTPFQIAKDYTKSFDERDEARWNEYVDAIVGERMITYSRSLSELRTPESHATDEEIAEMEDITAKPDEDSTAQPVGEGKLIASFDLPNTPWFNLWWYTANEHTKLLEALENDGEIGLKLFIEEVRRRYEE